MQAIEEDIWEEFIKKNATDGGLLQSFDWGEFQREYGREVFRVGEFVGGDTNKQQRVGFLGDESIQTPFTPSLSKREKAVGGWQIIKMPLPMGMSYLYVPRPVENQKSKIKNQNDKLKIKNSEFIDFLKKLAEREKVIFVRVDQSQELKLQNFGFKKVGISVQPQEELWLDLSPSEAELLQQMKSKTRYNIKVAEKHNVKIFNFQFSIFNQFLMNQFSNLIKRTSQRQNIKPHPKRYYEKMFEVLGREKMAEIWLAEYQGKVLAGALVTYYNSMATYLHGGSSDEDKNVMAPHLLHWEIIKDAKKRGMRFYNFGGVSLANQSWAGITRFKTGFAPAVEFRKYAGVVDLPVNKFWYGIYKLVKILNSKS